MLAYVFWHRPRDGDAVAAYEQALSAFHRSLARNPPVGTCATAAFRVAELPWFEQPATGEPLPAYEDWYLVEDYAALGVLNEAAVGRGHTTTHTGVARRAGAGAGALYAHLEGRSCAESLGRAAIAVWISRPFAGGDGARAAALAELLGDGMEPGAASLWARQLVLGPAPELCLLAREPPAGVAEDRLPAGWRAQTVAREVVWGG